MLSPATGTDFRGMQEVQGNSQGEPCAERGGEMEPCTLLHHAICQPQYAAECREHDEVAEEGVEEREYPHSKKCKHGKNTEVQPASGGIPVLQAQAGGSGMGMVQHCL